MATKWTLHVENFAKIRSADLEIAPLVGIVGENNTGKSYLMSLLWGVVSQHISFASDLINSKEYIACKNIIWRVKEADIELGKEDLQSFVDLYNFVLNEQKKDLLESIFNYPVEAGLIEIRNFSCEDGYKIKKIQSASEEHGGTPLFLVRDNEISIGARFFVDDDTFVMMAIGLLTRYIIFFSSIESMFNGECIYLPASRTGFMLTYPQLVGQSLESSYSLDRYRMKDSQLTRPYISFLQFIAQYRKDSKLSKSDRSLATFIEKELTKGKIVATKDKMPEFKYRIEGEKNDIPLHISSSVITEVAPLLMSFQNQSKSDVYFIEEPEAHLHPALQQKMAQLLIRMVSAKKTVFITTHSDTIIQHINNMIMLKKASNVKQLMKKYRYKEEDLLDMEDCNLYQFKHEEDGKSTLVPLEKTNYGFVVPTFNDSLVKLLDETSAFQGE